MDIGKNLVQIIKNRMIQNLRRNVELEIISQEILFIISFLKFKKEKESSVSYINYFIQCIFPS